MSWRLLCQLLTLSFHFSHRAPGRTADCLCLPRGAEGSCACELPTPSGTQLTSGGRVECLRQGWPQGLWVLGGRGLRPVAGSSPFPSWLSHFLFGERGGGSGLGGGPSAEKGLRGGRVLEGCPQGCLFVPRDSTTCILRGRSTETSR